MEFRYYKGPKKWLLILLGIGLIAIMLYLWDISFEGFDFYHLINDLIVPMCALLFSIYMILRDYKRVRNDVIKLDEDGIFHENNGTKTILSWADVKKVEWGGYSPNKPLIVKGEKNEIGIGYHINNFDQIIQFIKLKVGDRFITYDIPWKLKNPKTY